MNATQEEKLYLAQQMIPELITKYNTTLLVGKAARVFKRMFSGELYTMTKADEVREFLNQWNIQHDKPIVFEDMALMTKSVQAYLLKFIEEPPAPLVILASKDNLSPVILSRCKRVIKLEEAFTTKNVGISNFIESKLKADDEIRTFQRENKDEALPDDLLRYTNERIEQTSLEECPDYLYQVTNLKLINPNISNYDKYLELL